MSQKKKPLRCRLSFHAFVRKYSDGDLGANPYYLECTRCGKYVDLVPKIGGI
ncbi:hypothetical protein NOCA2610038 [metagenome]|uniref:Uncharacterized protein n=1 Tax=metagenome TaxID=256318 RepID=A0A2P2CC01_9ZZZZ